MIKEYYDLAADVRYDNRLHSIRHLVQPNDLVVQKIAAVLYQKSDFIAAAQDFVDSFTRYGYEEGDYWSIPDETLSSDATRFNSDCDCKAILLCSILRNYIPADKVFCSIGTHVDEKGEEGHMWVVAENPDGSERLVEATGPSYMRLSGLYRTYALFNDKVSFSYPAGLKEFGLFPIVLVPEEYA